MLIFRSAEQPRKTAAHTFPLGRRWVITSVIAAAVLGPLLSFPRAERSLGAQSEHADSTADFRGLLQQLTSFSPDPCGPPYGREENWHTYHAESLVFEKAADMVTQRLNAPTATPGLPRDVAADSLKNAEATSAEVNAAWPDENRFHFQVLDVMPALVVKMTVRTHAIFFVFGIPETDGGRPNRLWRSVGSGEEAGGYIPQSDLELYSLRRGPSGKARFLAKFGRSGCAGSIGVAYDAREWNPEDSGDLEKIIKQSGSFGLNGNVRGFPEIGQFRAEGLLITLPYCWFSAIDTWDNPNLCALDSYDLSGDVIKFRSRRYNRPDLIPVAKSIEYAEQRDYPAVRGYCASSELAHRLVREIPPDFFAEDIRVIRTGIGRERVELGEGADRFDLERRGGRWVVAAFRIK
jgi:hypothetical protein